MRIKHKLSKQLNENIRDSLPNSFKEKFNIEIETNYSIFSVPLVTVRSDGKPMTKAQYAWVQSYEKGYLDAWEVVEKL